MKKIISKLLIFGILVNLFLPLDINKVSAIDTDGTATLNLSVSSQIDESNIVGKNFDVNITLKNQNSSDGDAYKPGFIIVIPKNVSFVSSTDLGSPTKTLVHIDGSKILFFKTNDILIKGDSNTYSLTLTSEDSIELFSDKDVKVAAYAEDNIYGRGVVPSGSPAGTLPGGVDLANSGSVTIDFPDNLDSTGAYEITNFNDKTKFVPYDIEKSEVGEMLIGNEYETTLTIKGNNLGSLKNFHLQDIIPNNRKFVSFTQTGGVGDVDIRYNKTSSGKVLLNLSNITVPKNTDLQIKYKTLALAFPITEYTNSGTNILLNTGSVIADKTPTNNNVKLLAEGTWNDGNNDIQIVNPIQKTSNSILKYGILTKNVSKSNPEIGETIRYNISFTASQNTSYKTGTIIKDLIPDGLSYLGNFTSSNNGFSITGNSTNIDGETTIIFSLNSGEIKAGETISINYDVLVDGIFEGSGDQNYENSEEITNTANFNGIVKDSTNIKEWGYTDSSIIGNNINYTETATIIGPNPTSKKNLVSIKLPDGTVYNSNNPLPNGAGIPPGSEVEFSLSMIFPNMHTLGAQIKDYLPLIMGPKESIYDIKFQDNPNLKDIKGNSIVINDNDGDSNFDNCFGSGCNLTLSNTGTWVKTEPANTVVFDLGNFDGKKTFSILFKLKVLPTKPSGYDGEGKLDQKNVSLGFFEDDAGAKNVLSFENIPFIFDAPAIEVNKTTTSNQIVFGKKADYKLEITNTGASSAYLENIIDIIPENMNLVGGFSAKDENNTNISDLNITQSGTGLIINFNKTGTLNRSKIPSNSKVIINYSLTPTKEFIIKENDERKNIISLDYYSTETATGGINNFGPVEDEASFRVGGPSITRNIISSSESTSTLNNLEIGEEIEFETIISLPGGKYTNAKFDEILNSRLEFLTGTLISHSGSLSFSKGTIFSGNTIDFGDIINNDSTLSTTETIVIRTKARVKNTTTTKQNNISTIGKFTYTNSIKQINKSVNIIVPELNITKDVNKTTAELGDTLTYTINISHTGNSNANAYDITLKDILPTNLEYQTGSLTGNSSFSGTQNDLFTSGIKLETLNLGSSESISYSVNIKDSVIPGKSEINTGSIVYSSLDADNSSFEKNDFSDFATSSVNIEDVAISHKIVNTSSPDTNKSKFNTSYEDASIGEEITYSIYLEIPKIKINGYKLKQNLPSGIKFLTGSIKTDGVNSHSKSDIKINPDNIISFDFGNIDNSSGNGTGFILETKVLVENDVNNTAGAVKNSSINLVYSSENKTKTDNTPNFEIVEPNLNITKIYNPNSGDAGDKIVSKIIIGNSGSSVAYNINRGDLNPINTTLSGLTNNNFNLNPGKTKTFNFETLLGVGVNYGEVLNGTGIINSYKSIDSSAGKIYPKVEDNDTINIIGNEEISKILKTSNKANIGDKITYEIKVKVPESKNQNIKITDKLPLGLAYIDSNFKLDSDLTYTGTINPNINGQEIIWDLKNISNNSSNNSSDYITITYDVVVLDTSNNNNLDTKAENVKVDYNSGTKILTGSVSQVQIVEPNIYLNISKNYTYGDKINYIFTITNSGNTDAYDLELKNIFDNAGINLESGFTLTNSGGVSGLTQNGNNFSIEKLEKNTGNPLQFSVTGSLDSSVGNNTNIKLDSEITYTSKNGNYTKLISTNTDNRERNGDGGVDDYKNNDSENFKVLLPILNKNITVDKIKGDIGDYFEYTITLVNSGSVDLTNIGVDLDIAENFENFIISKNAGGIDNSNSGALDIDNISLNIGETKTIKYKVKAKLDTPDLTNIDSIANISNSKEGAIGGNPNVEVKIHAPVFETNITQKDDNSGKVLKGDTITNKFNIKNTGTSTGKTLEVEIDLGKNVVYETGSLFYSSGSLIDTSTIKYDEKIKKLSFTIISLGTGEKEDFYFKTKVTGEATQKIISKLSVKSEKDIKGKSISNELIIGKKYSGGGSISNNGGGSSFIPNCSSHSLICEGGIWKLKNSYNCTNDKIGKKCKLKEKEQKEKIIEKKETENDKNIETEKINKNKKEVSKEKTVKKENIDLKELQDFLKYYEEKKKTIQKIKKEENSAGIDGLKGLPRLLPQTGTPISNRIKTLKNSKVETSLPSKSIFKLAGSKNEKLDYRLQVLDERDRNSNLYIVLPTNGLVIPINQMQKGTTDYENIISGYEIDVNKYLKNGVAEYPETSIKGYGETGNKVIFGHSSYWKKDNGRYKTHFQKIIELDKDEEIWIYKKIENGNYKIFKYFVENSYNTPANDVSVLKPGVGKNLTLITCTPIGGIKSRWIIKAKFYDEYLEKLENEIYFKNVSTKHKLIINKFIEKIKKIENSEEKKQILYKLYNRTNNLLKEKNNKKIIDLLTYIKYRVALEITKNKLIS